MDYTKTKGTEGKSRGVVRLMVFVALVLLITTPVVRSWASTTPSFENQSILAPGGVGADKFGGAVAVNGNFSLVGAPEAAISGTRIGAVYSYVRNSSGAWIFSETLLAPGGGDADKFGASVTISRGLAIIGAPKAANAGGTRTGAAYVYFMNVSGMWIHTQTLWGFGDADEFGASVFALGDVALIGAPNAANSSGTKAGLVYDYRRGSTYTLRATLLPLPSGATSERFGESVSFDPDFAMIGAPGARDGSNVQTGAAHVFRRDSSGNWVWQQKILAPGGQNEDKFGFSVSLDGDVALIGAYDNGAGTRPGAAYDYRLNTVSTWIHNETLQLTSVGDSDFGYSVLVSGGMAWIGAPRTENAAGTRTGKVYELRSDLGSGWMCSATRLAAGGGHLDFFGFALATSADTALFGALDAKNAGGDRTGVAYIFDSEVLANCQGIDNENVLSINGMDGLGSNHIVRVGETSSIQFDIVMPSGGGNGKFVVHLNPGTPDVTTVTALPSNLGDICFPLIASTGSSPVCVFNNVGKVNQLGSSNYFGAATPDPSRAPTTYLILNNGDPINLPAGSIWTVQGAILNPTASGLKPASVTNAIVMMVD